MEAKQKLNESNWKERFKNSTYPTEVQLYGGLEDHIVDEFGFKTSICSENKGRDHLIFYFLPDF